MISPPDAGCQWSGVAAIGVALVVIAMAAGCGPTREAGEAGASTRRLAVEVVETYRHDRTRFTQGLEIADGVLYEGTGLRGRSRLIATEFSGSGLGEVRATAELDSHLFGEGLTVVGDRLWQLTWTDGVAIERNLTSLAERRRATYAGEGWGLCFDRQRLVMSDGSARLTFRDPETFDPLGYVTVRNASGEPVERLNELECVEGAVLANVWQTDTIVRIDPASGRIRAQIDASGLLSHRQQREADVLNGIAAIPRTDEFLLTGKNWPRMFRVRFVSQP
jgi:glutaminyl-peptide cyclotransferase